MKKTKKRPLIALLAIMLCIALPLPLFLSSLFFSPNVYGETFLGALSPKLERLKTAEGERLIVIGGSSVAFGLDSELLSEYTGYEVVNFGLYATLGTKVMLDLSLPHIRKGDIVVIAPELDPQTLSAYFGAEAVWQAANSDTSVLLGVAPDNILELCAAYPDYMASVIAQKGKPISPDGIYRRDSFNEYGDISYPREYNIMTAGYDVNKPVSLSTDIFDEEFFELVNTYTAQASLRGARVYYSFSPVNRSAIEGGANELAAEELYRFVSEKLVCPVISDPARLMMHEGYFYDTNFHLNDAGAQLRTQYLIEDVRRALGISERLDFEEPQIPARPTGEMPDNWIENEWSDMFVYEPFADGLRVVGIAEAAKGKTTLEIPYIANGQRVLVIGAGALSGADALAELTIHSNITLIENGAFSGAPNLKKVHIMIEDADGVETGAELFNGAPADLKLYFHTQTSYDNFISGYWWGVHSGRMVNAAE